MRSKIIAVVMLLLFLAFSTAIAASSDVALQWDKSSDDADITEYEIGYSKTTKTYTSFVSAGKALEKTVNLPDGTWYLAVRGKNPAKPIIGEWSNELKIVLKTTFSPPGNFRKKNVPSK